MKIYVVGSSKNKFLPLDNIREKFLIDKPHEGDNIDDLNPWYCELTGLYYLWKHVDDEIVGLEHYRRYFVNSKNKLLNEIEIKNLLEKYDVILYRGNVRQSAIYQMSSTGKRSELALALATLYTNYGKDIADYFYKKIKSNYVYLGNMFICKKEIADKFFEFIFDVLKNFDDTHKFKTPRIDGYISEYFMEPWFRYNGYKIYNGKRIVFDKKLKRRI